MTRLRYPDPGIGEIVVSAVLSAVLGVWAGARRLGGPAGAGDTTCFGFAVPGSWWHVFRCGTSRAWLHWFKPPESQPDIAAGWLQTVTLRWRAVAGTIAGVATRCGRSVLNGRRDG